MCYDKEKEKEEYSYYLGPANRTRVWIAEANRVALLGWADPDGPLVRADDVNVLIKHVSDGGSVRLVR